MAVLLLNRHLGAEDRHAVTYLRSVLTKRQPLNEEIEMKALFNRFVQEESGQDLIEYGLLVGIITTGAITAIGLIGPKVASYYSDLETALP
jgi:pilus assembly protein Flp/PilA